MAIFGRGMFIALAGLLAAQVHAQPYAGPGGVFVCKSSGYQQNYCEADTRGGVTMTRQISNSACIQGRTWGYDRRGVWVAQGCEAEFMLGQRMPPPMSLQIVHCESNDYRQDYCRVDTRGGVRLRRQTSSSACIRGRTWGANGGGIWVSDGCQGDFAVGGGWDPGAPPQQSVFMPERTVRCESNGDRTVRCDVDTRGGVRLAAQLSSSACIQSRTWGWDRAGVWVSNGCRADFRIGGWYR
ncbi:MAG TPA: DUF3011 domain-containing protein [Xanthomonadaceae bacterium]|nr:DUF3011 domain-containing protein [Xanthomonadaceae bacterium]